MFSERTDLRFTYAMRPYFLSTDNNCAGQWCFFEPCEAFCPVELCYDSRIDWASRLCQQIITLA